MAPPQPASAQERAEAREETSRSLFRALTSRGLSRNKQFASFSAGLLRIAHRRFRHLDALRREAERLAAIPDSSCWVHEDGDALLLHLEAPRLLYRRIVALRRYEWDWLLEQQGIQALLALKLIEG
ncbi:MAG: hypothetical protein HY423_12090 [Candidatus Lambdaproteobacteria bacterium]|nr:hypothetical protein [Candidatus Lambdaproteobacteria bacterium]